ncbi:MAG: hypothetical protein JW841_18080 [Deltaproteobacteria bacterium]|nr:hypothetical protein [Deltaproteobacteria bacterium]
MNGGIFLKFGLVCEGKGDARTIPLIVWRVLCHQFDYLTDYDPSCISWRGLSSNKNYLPWAQVKRIFKLSNLKIHGNFSGTRSTEFVSARKALLLMQKAHHSEPIDLVFLIRDADKLPEQRYDALINACNSFKYPFFVAVGVPIAKRECWVLATITIEIEDFDSQLKTKIAQLEKDLGFNPIFNSHRLNASEPNAKRSAKRVLNLLTDDNIALEDTWISSATPEIYINRGIKNGLAMFVQNIKKQLSQLYKKRKI